MISIEEFIEKENMVRFVDAFVEKLELDKLGFEIAILKKKVVKFNNFKLIVSSLIKIF